MSSDILSDLTALLQSYGGGKVASLQRFNEFFESDLEELQESKKEFNRLIEEIEYLKEYSVEEYLTNNLELYAEIGRYKKDMDRIKRKLGDAENLLRFLGVELK